MLLRRSFCLSELFGDSSPTIAQNWPLHFQRTLAMAAEESLFLPLSFPFPLCANLPFSPSWFCLNPLTESTGSSSPARSDAELLLSVLRETLAPQNVVLLPSCSAQSSAQGCSSYLRVKLRGCSPLGCVLVLVWRHKAGARGSTGTHQPNHFPEGLLH